MFFRQFSLFIGLVIWQPVLPQGKGMCGQRHGGRAEPLLLAEAHIQTGLNCWGNFSLTYLFCHHPLTFFFTVSLISLGIYWRTPTLFRYSCFPNFPGQVNIQVMQKSVLRLERVLEWRVFGKAEIVVESYLLSGF